MQYKVESISNVVPNLHETDQSYSLICVNKTYVGSPKFQELTTLSAKTLSSTLKFPINRTSITEWDYPNTYKDTRW